MLEDRPLALCDSRTVTPSDLIACDRIIPDRVGEVYYLKHNPEHKWRVRWTELEDFKLTESNFRYWLSRQTCFEALVFVLYDTKGGDHARCIHILPSQRTILHLLIDNSLSTCLFSKPGGTRQCSPTLQRRNQINCHYSRVIILPRMILRLYLA